MTDRVRITDVAPRDGLQNEPGEISTADKLRLIQRLLASGADEIEVAAFVHPRAVPQLADADALPEGIAGLAVVLGRPAGWPLLSALTPNERGLDRLLDANERAAGALAAARDEQGGAPLIGKAAVFAAASETFSVRNINASIEESMERFAPVIERARAEGLRTRGYVSCAVACPFEGAIEPGRVAEVAGRLCELGVEEIDLGDTIGAGDPDSVAAVVTEVVSALDGEPLTERGDPSLTLHLHDTRGLASSCVAAALELGVRSFDGAAGGLGGCPFASMTEADGTERRAPGNIATATLVGAVRGSGFAAGLRADIDDRALADASAVAASLAGGAMRAGGSA